jgi:hypothetical protein
MVLKTAADELSLLCQNYHDPWIELVSPCIWKIVEVISSMILLSCSIHLLYIFFYHVAAHARPCLLFSQDQLVSDWG